MSEPMTALTDYALAGVSAWLGWRLRGFSRFWALAFVALALAAFLGGTWHGFLHGDLLWKATTLAVGVASFGMVAGSAAVAPPRLRKILLTAAAAKLALYSAWMTAHDEFIYVIADSGSALAAVALLHLWRFNPWMLAGVAASAAAALAQAVGLAPHRHFNHNDLYHVIQIVAMVLFYHGARRLSVSRAS